ncbi:hypothetical protein RMCBS344292_06093 [Rhizopus microsporus]|nr:hypothetical protein RMCBS344292_06093 [Rhizopus microsporus]
MSSLTDKVEQKDSTLFSALSSAYPNMTSRKLTDADEKIERVFFDFEKIMDYVSSEDVNEEKHKKRKATASSVTFPNHSHISSTHEDGVVYKPGEEGSLILLSFICSLIRNTLYPSSKLKALDILFALGERVPDDVKLDRLVPYLMCLLTDEAALVRANAIKTLTRILCMVESISPINARIFPEYILPSLRSFTTDPDALVRSTYASCIALLAETALRFLEMTQTDNIYPSVLESEDLDFEASVYFVAFFESIKGVGTFVGARSLEEYILPLMIQALTDPEEFVVEKVLNSLTSLADLGLFPKMKIWEIVGIVWPLMCHPNIWIRDGSVGFISSAIKHLPETDVWCIVYPLLRPFLRSDIADINEELLLENIESPIPRQVYEQAILWATKATIRSNFWKKQRESFKSGSSTIMGMNENEEENSEDFSRTPTVSWYEPRR